MKLKIREHPGYGPGGDRMVYIVYDEETDKTHDNFLDIKQAEKYISNVKVGYLIRETELRETNSTHRTIEFSLMWFMLVVFLGYIIHDPLNSLISYILEFRIVRIK